MISYFFGGLARRQRIFYTFKKEENQIITMIGNARKYKTQRTTWYKRDDLQTEINFGWLDWKELTIIRTLFLSSSVRSLSPAPMILRKMDKCEWKKGELKIRSEFQFPTHNIFWMTWFKGFGSFQNHFLIILSQKLLTCINDTTKFMDRY